jgi:hypothetical protein
VPFITPQKPSKNPGTLGIPEPFSKNPSPNPQEQQGTHQIERREGVTKRARLPRRSWVEKGEHAREGRWDCDEKRARLGGGVGRALFCLCVDVTVAAGRERLWAGERVDSYGTGSDGNTPPACSYLRGCTVCPARGDDDAVTIILPALARRLKPHHLVKF